MNAAMFVTSDTCGIISSLMIAVVIESTCLAHSSTLDWLTVPSVEGRKEASTSELMHC